MPQGQWLGRSMGMALTSCTVPHAGKPTFDLPDDEMEIGIGIHGEPGRTRMKLKPADEITEMLMEPILNDLPFRASDNVLLFVNSMGGTPLIELYVVYRKAYEIAVEAGLKCGTQPDRTVHYLAGDGGLLDHAAENGRRTDQVVGRSG
jgi:dihydroxyacetone kinase-like protein